MNKNISGSVIRLRMVDTYTFSVACISSRLYWRHMMTMVAMAGVAACITITEIAVKLILNSMYLFKKKQYKQYQCRRDNHLIHRHSENIFVRKNAFYIYPRQHAPDKNHGKRNGCRTQTSKRSVDDIRNLYANNHKNKTGCKSNGVGI